MAQLVVSAVGAAVGFMIGGPAGAQVGWVAGSMVGAYALAETQHQEGPRLKDLKITGTDYGETVPWVTGGPRIAGQIIWASNRREHKHTQRQGGKGGGGGASSTSYTYSVDLMILLSENPIPGVSRVWLNNELVFANSVVQDGLWREMRVYHGTHDQLPDPLYEAAVGVGNAPAYRGRGYVVIENLDLGGGGNIPNLTFEIGSVDPRLSMLVAVMATRVDTDVHAALDVSDLTQPTWRSYFSEFGAVGAMRFLGYGPEVAAGDTGLVNSALAVAIDVDALYHLNAKNDSEPNDVCAFDLEFLDGTGAIVAIIRTPGYLAGAQATHRLFYGSSYAALTQAGPFGNTSGSTYGYVRFEDGVLRFTQVSGVNQSFAFACDARSIRSMRARNVRAISHGGSGSDPSARIIFQRVSAEAVDAPSKALDDAVRRLMLRAGYSAQDFDVSALAALTKPLHALALSQVASTRSALEVLQKSYFFECSTTDKIVFRPRATAPVVRIPFVDLGFASDAGGSDDPFTLKLGNDLEQPAQLALTYANMAGDYNADTQFSDRLVTGQASTQTLQLPLGMYPAEAKACADALLFDMVASMHSTTLSLPMRYAFLEGGDVVEAVAHSGRVLRLRVLQIKLAGVRIEAQCCLDDVGALDSAAITDTGYISVQEPARVPDTLWHALDIPLLRDADDAPGFYLAAAPDSINFETDQWNGAVVAMSWDGVDYAELLTLPDASVIGSCSTVLPAWGGGAVFDEASTLTVVVRGMLASSTREAMLLDEAINALLVGSEVVRFRHAELLAANVATHTYTYRISSLLRGCRGTEWAIDGHIANERCVLLGQALRRRASQVNEMQRAMQLKAQTSSKLLSAAAPRTFTDAGVALKPFSPAGLRGLVDGAGVHLSWQRRTRLAYRYGGLAPVVPVGEATQSYRLQVWQGSTLLRTETVSTPHLVYSPAMRAADGLAGGELLRFAVAQLSAVVGAGYETSIERTCT